MGIAEYDQITNNLGRFGNFIAREIKGMNYGVWPDVLQVRTGGWTPTSTFSLAGVSLSFQQTMRAFQQSLEQFTSSLTLLMNQLRRTFFIQTALLVAILVMVGWILIFR